MPVIPSHEILSKRWYYSSNGWGSGARWAFFALFGVAFIIAIMSMIFVNRKRLRRGVAPIYGTSWITPPAYRANVNNNMPENNVPTYTAQANEADMGYYDQHGNFVQNPNVKSPEEAHVRQNNTGYSGATYGMNTYYMGGDAPVVNDTNAGQYQRPEGPPGSPPTASQATATNTGSSQPIYSAPNVPPPQQKS